MKLEQEWLRWPEEGAQEAEAQTALLTAYRRLVRSELPAAARAENWVLRADHCFARVILDAVFGGCWYAHLSRERGSSAESQLNAEQLVRALQIGQEMLTGGPAEVARLNTQSLRWRGESRDDFTVAAGHSRRF